jgi:uncharacterized protein DUF3303
MRMMLTVQPDVELGNEAIAAGTLMQVIGEVSAIVNPEAMYIGPKDGKRTMFMFFEADDSSIIAQLTEPLFQKLNATVEMLPVMNQEELMKGMTR